MGSSPRGKGIRTSFALTNSPNVKSFSSPMGFSLNNPKSKAHRASNVSIISEKSHASSHSSLERKKSKKTKSNNIRKSIFSKNYADKNRLSTV